jgi:hypothetical protein
MTMTLLFYFMTMPNWTCDVGEEVLIPDPGSEINEPFLLHIVIAY